MDFIRFNSAVKNTKKNKKEFSKLGFINAPMHEHAEDTHLLDLTKTEEELLQNIKKKDRYYINRAQKEGVKVIKGNTKEQKNILIKMHLEHSKKVGYHPFSEKFINYLYEVF
jgi:lipid II:glycine glycyltransferase (peptidoglycan interpeptide bridge formation enzyme)